MGTIEDLNTLLADEYVHLVRTLAFHWNVSGPRFLDLHTYFEELYNETRDAIDEHAERIRMLGGMPLSSMARFLKEAHLTEIDDARLDPDRMVTAIIADREHLIEDLKRFAQAAADRDAPTDEDYFIARARDIELSLYKLRSIAKKV
jgi:starvation-inducible DNA-binding protein